MEGAKHTLYLVPTPVGNLEDITLRALRVLQEVDTILCEDTRTSSFLLKHYKIGTRLESFHAHNEHQRTAPLVERMKAGEKIALITDAGTPGISDPAYLLVRECIRHGIEPVCLPGATAFVPALVQSGFPIHDFYFAGFLPHKKGRQTRLRELAAWQGTLVLYESPHRLHKLLLEVQEHLGNRPVSVSRELTKMFEETRRGTAAALAAWYELHEPKGELVVCIGAAVQNAGPEPLTEAG